MKFYITTAIDYVNGRPHIGHALEKIQADVLARYHRLKGDEVLYLTGTDEHGAKIVRSAMEAGRPVAEFVDENSEKFKKLKEGLGLSWDDFIRTSDQARHWPGAQKLWQQLAAAGDLYKKKYRGLYCLGHEAFVTEKDLVEGKCRDHQKEPEVVEEENWFFRLSKYGAEIESKIRNDELRIIPETRQNEILSLIKSGLEDVSFSRPAKDLSWGIPVPNDPDDTIYVWCDALANYITAIGYGQAASSKQQAARFEKFWPADLHIIGKDILRFHAAIWPGMLLSAGLPLPRAVFVHGFITVEGEKMSKTVGNVVNPVELVGKYGADPVRYYLLREIPSHEDGDFSHKKFEERYSGDLANGLGNLVARVAALGEKLGRVDFDFQKDIEPQIKSECGRVFAAYETCLADIKLNEALAKVWELISLADGYINDKKPWAIDDQNELGRVVANAGIVVGEGNNLVKPFLPATSEAIGRQISYQDGGFVVKKGKTLFPRLIS